jgi:hypothetical protein
MSGVALARVRLLSDPARLGRAPLSIASHQTGITVKLRIDPSGASVRAG